MKIVSMSYSTIASHAVVGDTTDEKVLKNLGIRNFDHVIVAIGDNIQASILTTIILKELGVKNITVKAQNDYHEKVLVKLVQIMLYIRNVIWEDGLLIIWFQTMCLII